MSIGYTADVHADCLGLFLKDPDVHDCPAMHYLPYLDVVYSGLGMEELNDEVCGMCLEFIGLGRDLIGIRCPCHVFGTDECYRISLESLDLYYGRE